MARVLHRSLDGKLACVETDLLELNEPASSHSAVTFKGVHIEFVSGPAALGPGVARDLRVDMSAMLSTSHGDLFAGVGSVPLGDAPVAVCYGYWLSGAWSVHTHFYGDNVDTMLAFLSEPDIRATDEGPLLTRRTNLRAIRPASVTKEVAGIGVMTLRPEPGATSRSVVTYDGNADTAHIVVSEDGASTTIMPVRNRNLSSVARDLNQIHFSMVA
jgi:hypothetical protein